MFKGSWILGFLSLSFSPIAFGANTYGDFKVVGTGADAGISFEFLAVTPLLTPGLATTLSFVNCTVPAGETCGTGTAQVNYTARGGVIRLVTTGASGTSRTWNFPSLLNTGLTSLRPAPAWSQATSFCRVRTPQPANHRATPPIPRSSFPSRSRSTMRRLCTRVRRR